MKAFYKIISFFAFASLIDDEIIWMIGGLSPDWKFYEILKINKHLILDYYLIYYGVTLIKLLIKMKTIDMLVLFLIIIILFYYDYWWFYMLS